MKLDYKYLDKTIQWTKLRCGSNMREHRKNLISFMDGNSNESNYMIHESIALDFFKNLDLLYSELCKSEPNISLRGMYGHLASCIIREDYERAEKIKNMIIRYNYKLSSKES